MTLDNILTKHGIEQPRGGSQVGDGWLPLIDKLCADLVAAGWDRCCEQVKEKFGGLRFYIRNGDTHLRYLIDQAERKSFTICETCGEPGSLRTNTWWKTACEKHARKE